MALLPQPKPGDEDIPKTGIGFQSREKMEHRRLQAFCQQQVSFSVGLALDHDKMFKCPD